MAKIFISVPSDWPDFVVTSYYRPKGSHSNYKTFDIAIQGTFDRSPGSIYWFYYFQTAFLLWAAQRQGKVNLAAPPDCPHFHLENDPAFSRMGIEWIKYSKGQCNFITSTSVNRLNYLENLNFFKRVRYDLGKNYFDTFRNWAREIEYKFTSNEKYITVNANGVIGEADLQKKLIDLFGNGSMASTIADNAAQIIGYTNAEAAADDITASPWFLLAVGGSLLGAAYLIAKEVHFWQEKK
jgi:hypothetical protein